MGSRGKDLDSQELTDVVSMLIRCAADKSYLLAYHQSSDYYLPHMPLNERTWGSACKDLTTKYIGEVLNPDNLIRVIRIWQGDNKPHLINAVFEFIVTIDQKNRLKLPDLVPGTKEKLMWMKIHEVLRLSQLEMLASPELKMYFSQGAGDHELKLLKDSAEVTSNLVIEVNKVHILSPKKININDALIGTMSLTETDLTFLYQEYLKICYPNVLMSLKHFRQFCSKLRWQEPMITPLFRMGDLTDRKALTFREVMYIAAVMEPDITCVGAAAEARCKLIFRYFDADRDNKLNPLEFKNLVASIRNGKSNVAGESLEKDVEKGYKDFGVEPGSDISMKDFVLQIGLLKFRGTSSILKAKNSIKLYIRSLSGESDDEDFRDTILDLPEYTLAWHSIKVGKSGIKEIKELLQIEGLFAKPPTALKKNLSDESLNMFNVNSIESLTLSNLKLYTQLLSHKEPSGQEYKKIMLSLPTQLVQLSKMVTQIFASESRLIRINSPVYILGDLHGNFPDICCFERIFWNMGLHLSAARMLLLGDYVDRGAYGVEVVAYLFAQKVKNPNKIFMLRGNHELRDIQRNFTFYNECLKKFGTGLGATLWQEINKAFDHMPLAAIIDNKVFCCHGGIPAPWLCPHIDYINKIPCPLTRPDEESPLAWDILWNDPVREDYVEEDIEEELNENEGFALNRRRGTAHVFDSAALNRFLSRNKLSFLIRAHEVQRAGVQVHSNRKMMTVFSSSQYSGGNNDAACVLAANNKLRIFRLDTTDFHKVRPSPM